MTTPADEALLERIEAFDKTPRSISVTTPATLISFTRGKWVLAGGVSRSNNVRVNESLIPVNATPDELRRILHQIPPPGVFKQPWNVMVSLSNGITETRPIAAETSQLAVLLAGAELEADGVFSAGVEPVNVQVREAI